MKTTNLLSGLALICGMAVNAAAQTITTTPDGTTTTISSSSSYIVADGSEYIAVVPTRRSTEPFPSVPIRTIIATPTNGPTTVTLHARTKDGTLPVGVSFIHAIRADTPHSRDLALGILPFAGRNGDWTATNVAPCDYDVVLGNANYVENARDFQILHVKAGTNYVVDFVLSNGATFKGRVLDDATGKPIAGASVSGETEGLSFPLRTDAEGRYEMSHVTGALELCASETNHVAQAIKLDAAGEDRTISVPDIRLQRGGRISGRVGYPAGIKRDADAFVSLEIQGSFPTNSVISGAYGGADGIFRTGPLPPGICTLHVKWEPAYDPGKPVETWRAFGSIIGIKVTAGQDTTNVLIPTKMIAQTNGASGR